MNYKTFLTCNKYIHFTKAKRKINIDRKCREREKKILLGFMYCFQYCDINHRIVDVAGVSWTLLHAQWQIPLEWVNKPSNHWKYALPWTCPFTWTTYEPHGLHQTTASALCVCVCETVWHEFQKSVGLKASAGSFFHFFNNGFPYEKWHSKQSEAG